MPIATLETVSQLVADLVRIESVNPSLVPSGAGEEKIARFVAELLRQAGLEWRLQEVASGRFNAIGRLCGSGGGRSLMLNGHLDTVGVAGMEQPFSPRVEHGRLYGRGAQDMKGGLAAALVAVQMLAEGPPLRGDVVVTAVADEEYQSAGTRALVASGIRADAAIVLEPTGGEIATAHKGFAWADIEIFGRAAHGSRPEEGLDAIVCMGHVLVEVEALQRTLAARTPHPLLGCGSVHASLISGGQELSSYPAHCKLSLERRLVPGEDGGTFAAELEGVVSKIRSRDSRFRVVATPGYWAQPLETPRESSIVQQLAASTQRITGRERALGAQSFWTDAALLAEAGIPSVLFGPGGAGLHSAQEYVELSDVLTCAQVVADCARTFCGT